jgi:hypothetical protein
MIVAILIVSMAATLASLPLIGATARSGEMASYAFVSVEPNPVGVGQTTYAAMWVDFPMPGATEANSIRRHDYKLTITAPDGTKTTKTWSIVNDTTGVQSTSFTPTQTGNYTFLFEYPEQNYTWTTADGGSASYTGTKFLAANSTTTLTVQEDAVQVSSPDAALPTEYWSRPIYGTNDNWYTIASNWLGGNYLGTVQQSGYNLYQADGSAPNSSHILWNQALEDGGVVGGSNTYTDGATYYSGGSYEGRLQNAIILDGRLYYKAPLSDNATGGAYVCRDLKTGEILWQNDSYSFYPTFGELYTYESPNQHGTISNGYLWQTVTTSNTTQTWIAYDSLTGKWLFNLTNVPVTSTVYTPTMSSLLSYTQNGEIVKYILNYNSTTKTGWLALWNWTSASYVAADSTGSGKMQYRPTGRIIDTSSAYSWNITINSDLTGNAQPTLQYVINGDTILGTSSSVTAGISTTRGTPDPYTVWTLDLTSNNIGDLVWKKSYEAPDDNVTRTLGPIDTINRVWTMTDSETMQWVGYNLDTGEYLWTTDEDMRSLQYFSSGSGSGQRAVTAYGNIYVQGYGGELFCFSCKDGSLVWKFNDTDSGIDTSWGLMPIFISAIADGKVYAFNNEHSPNSPLYNGYNIYCLNATTGAEIYKMLSWEGQSGGTGVSTAALADGSFVYYNYYDNSIYCLGKGATQTTVNAPSVSTDSGDSVVISGKVLDISSGTTQTKVAARFPNGVPVASDASESSWMEYVYMDQDKPSNFTGVQVAISVIDANGNYRTIGTTTTDSNGFYSYQWTPDIAGKYTVIATFAGSNSYYGSFEEASFAVNEAAATATPQPTQAPSAADLYFLPAIAALFIAIIISIVLTMVGLKKKA